MSQPNCRPASARPVTRRAVLLGGAAGLAATALTLPAPAARAAPGSVFTLGVASGEPTPTGVVLWTRLARDPIAADGVGAMGSRPVEVEWELAEDDRFRRVVRRGRTVAAPPDGFSVHVEVEGLRPGAEYAYRFRAGTSLSPAGRTRTSPAPGSLSPLTMAFASCAQYEHGFFTAYRRMAEERPDLILFVGDYIYEYGPGEYVAPGGNVRTFAGPEIRTLAAYRQRYGQQRSDVDLQAAHAAAPWVTVFDDHEVENNWADDVPEDPDPGFPARRAAAFRAFWENMPLRAAQRPRGQDLQLFRRVPWGSLATFHMLDTRQYRDDQACGDRFGSDCAERTAPNRTITGSAQERWLADGFRSSRSRWDVLGQQVFFSQLDVVDGPPRGFNPDAWDGYAVERNRIVDTWVAARTRNVVVLTGDVHSHYAADVRTRFDDPSSPVVGTELVTTSITSGGDGSDTPAKITTATRENPHVRFGSDRRGYVLTRWDAESVRADFRVLDRVTSPGAPVRTAASFRVRDREPGLRRT